MKERGLGGAGRQREGTTRVCGTVAENNLSRGCVCLSVCLFCSMDLQNKESNRFKTDILYQGRNQISVSHPLAKSDMFKLLKKLMWCTDLDFRGKKITGEVGDRCIFRYNVWLGASRELWVSGITGWTVAPPKFLTPGTQTVTVFGGRAFLKR